MHEYLTRVRFILPDFRRTLRALLGAALLVVSNGASAQAGCDFRNTPFADIVFSAPLDPSVAITVSASTQMRVRCPASVALAWTFAGANGNAPLRMKHATRNAFIPYSASASPVNIPNAANQFWRVTATVLGSAYENAPAGSYSDLLTVTINP
jgi:hypothetical protein